MKHSKEQIVLITKKLLADRKRQYWQNEEFYIRYEENYKIPYTEEIIPKCWNVGVPVDDEQFHHEYGASISIYIDDNTGEIKGYQDSSCGRPVPMRAKKDATDKYYFEIVKTK